MEASAYKNWIRGIFDRSAETYGQGSSSYFEYFAEKLVELATISSGVKILDVATGRGAILKRAAKAAGPHSSVVGIDLSHNMVEQTRKELKREKHAPSIEVLQMDAENLDFPDNSFDYIFCGFGVFFFPYVDLALKEFFRVLKPQGKLFLTTFQGKSPCLRLFREKIASLGYDKVTLHHFENEAFIHETLSSAGFKEIKIIPHETDHVHTSAKEWFDSLWSHGSRGNLEKLAPLTGAKTPKRTRN